MVEATTTASDKISLQEKMILFFDYSKIYCDFKNADAFEKEKVLGDFDCYIQIKETQEYLTNLLSTRRNQDWFLSKTKNSSTLTDNIDQLMAEALNSAEIYHSFQLVPREEIELIVVNKLRNIDEVIAIYSQRYRSELQITVFLKTDKYNNELMYKLLDIEYELHKQFSDPLLTFSYIPRIYENRREIIHPETRLLFER